MATVIDEFIVKLGLDPKAFKLGSKQIRDESKANADQAKHDADDTEKATSSAADKAVRSERKKAEGIEKARRREVDAAEVATGREVTIWRKRTVEQDDALRKQRQGFQISKNEVLGYLTVFTAGKALLDFARDTITSDAATGRLAKNVGTATESLAEWQGVLKTVGGTAQDANSDVTNLANNLQQFIHTGQAPMGIYFQRLQLQLKDLQDPSTALLKIAERFQGMKPTESFWIGQQMGLSPAMVTTLQKGPDAVRALLDVQRQLNTVNDETTRKAAEAQTALANLGTASENLGRSVLFNLTPSLVTLTGTLSDLAGDKGFQDLVKIMGGVASFAGQGVAEILTGKPQGTDRKAYGPYKSGYEMGKTRIVALGKPDAYDMGPARVVANGAFTRQPPAAPAAASGDFQRVSGKLQALGLPPQVAEGIAAGLGSESNFNPKASLTDKTGTTYGLAQWRGKRQRDLFAQFGSNPSEDDQLKFLMQELKTTHSDVGTKLSGMTDRSSILDTFIRQFEAPNAAGIQGDLQRGGQLLASNPAGSSTTVSIGQITVQTAATDATGIARDVGGELQKQIVLQANRGMY